MNKFVLSSPGMQAKLVKMASDMLGREISVSKLMIDFSGLNANNFKMSEASTFEQGTFAQADNISITLSIGALLRGNIEVHGFLVDKLSLTVIKNKDGSFNFSDLTGGNASEAQTQNSSAPTSMALSVSEGVIRNAALVYKDNMQGSEITAENFDFTFRNFALDKPFNFTTKIKASYKKGEMDEAFEAGGSGVMNLSGLKLEEATATLTEYVVNYKTAEIKGTLFCEDFNKPQITATVNLTKIDPKGLNLPDYVNYADLFPFEVKAGVSFNGDYTNIDSMDISSKYVNANVSGSMHAIKPDFKFKGKGKFAMPARAPLLTSGFDKEMKLSLRDFPVSADVTFEADQSKVNVSHLVGSFGQTRFTAAAVMAQEGEKYNVNARIIDYDLALNELARISEMATPYSPAGKIKGNGNVVMRGEKLTFNIDANLTDLGASYNGLVVAGVNGAVKLSDKMFELQKVKGIIDGSTFETSVKAQILEKNNQFDLAFAMNKFDYATIEKLMPAQENKEESKEEPKALETKKEEAPQQEAQAAELAFLNNETNVKIDFSLGEFIYPETLVKDIKFNTTLAGISKDMNKVNGTVNFSTGKGEFKQFEKIVQQWPILNVILTPLNAINRIISLSNLEGPQKLEIIEMNKAEFAAKSVNGAMTLTKGNIQTSLGQVTVGGKVSLPAQTSDLNISVKVEGLAAKVIKAPITATVKGPFTDPKINIKNPVSTAVETQVQATLDKAKEKGKETVINAVQNLFKKKK